MGEALEIRVLRGGRLESRHEVHAVTAVADGREAIRHGDAGLQAYWRSSMKPFQALPLAEDGVTRSRSMGAEELALCCASHVGSPDHVDGVRGLLGRLGLDEDDLACGSQRPFDGEAADRILRDGGSFSRLHNNCSGKHAGMLALALHHGWDPRGYQDLEHPVQARIREGLAAWIDRPVDALAWAVDGCGVPTPYLSLEEMAGAYARLGRAARRGDAAPAAVVGAMTAHPTLVSGAGRPVTRLMEATAGRVLAKEGAEGVFCLAVPGRGLGMAVKVADGARRAATPAVLRLLTEAGVLRSAEEEALARLRSVPIANTRGETVGRIVASEAPTEAAT